MSNRIDIRIIEYKDGKPRHLYYGLRECADQFHCHSELIKALIYTGNPFPYLDENITFDIAPSCHVHVERTHLSPTATRYYSFEVVPDEGYDSTGQSEGERSLP